jgi:hypothetical protein
MFEHFAMQLAQSVVDFRTKGGEAYQLFFLHSAWAD